MIYAFLEHARGPENQSGVMLYRITESGQTPSIAWWASPAAYFQGDEGVDIFDGMTRENVEHEYPDIVVFPNRTAAMHAWHTRQHYPEITGLYLNAIWGCHEAMIDIVDRQLAGSHDEWCLLTFENNRARAWLFGASHVLCGKAAELAWDAHKVFT